MGFARQKYWSGLLFPPPGDLPNPGTEPKSPALQADSLLSKSPGMSVKYIVLIYFFFTSLLLFFSIPGYHIFSWNYDLGSYIVYEFHLKIVKWMLNISKWCLWYRGWEILLKGTMWVPTCAWLVSAALWGFCISSAPGHGRPDIPRDLVAVVLPQRGWNFFALVISPASHPARCWHLCWSLLITLDDRVGHGWGLWASVGEGMAESTAPPSTATCAKQLATAREAGLGWDRILGTRSSPQCHWAGWGVREACTLGPATLPPWHLFVLQPRSQPGCQPLPSPGASGFISCTAQKWSLAPLGRPPSLGCCRSSSNLSPWPGLALLLQVTEKVHQGRPLWHQARDGPAVSLGAPALRFLSLCDDLSPLPLPPGYILWASSWEFPNTMPCPFLETPQQFLGSYREIKHVDRLPHCLSTCRFPGCLLDPQNHSFWGCGPGTHTLSIIWAPWMILGFCLNLGRPDLQNKVQLSLRH